ncbi:MAG: MarR family transcriptional regulator [Bacteroidetes bacterium]|nr:MarR family transcriptional regulator [Bacteroidota bacterium]
MKIEDEIKQKTFTHEFHKLQVNLLFTAAWLSYRTNNALKPSKITGQQFNILRILRGQHPEPASIKELTERMIDKSSNASRLVDKLIEKKLVLKSKSGDDSRRAEVIISPQGLELLEKASEVVDLVAQPLNESLTEQEARALNGLLDKLRG